MRRARDKNGRFVSKSDGKKKIAGRFSKQRPVKSKVSRLSVSSASRAIRKHRERLLNVEKKISSISKEASMLEGLTDKISSML